MNVQARQFFERYLPMWVVSNLHHHPSHPEYLEAHSTIIRPKTIGNRRRANGQMTPLQDSHNSEDHAPQDVDSDNTGETHSDDSLTIEEKSFVRPETNEFSFESRALSEEVDKEVQRRKVQRKRKRMKCQAIKAPPVTYIKQCVNRELSLDEINLHNL
jgi:hypothetical protein